MTEIVIYCALIYFSHSILAKIMENDTKISLMSILVIFFMPIIFPFILIVIIIKEIFD